MKHTVVELMQWIEQLNKPIGCASRTKTFGHYVLPKSTEFYGKKSQQTSFTVSRRLLPVSSDVYLRNLWIGTRMACPVRDFHRLLRSQHEEIGISHLCSSSVPWIWLFESSSACLPENDLFGPSSDEETGTWLWQRFFDQASYTKFRLRRLDPTLSIGCTPWYISE